MHASCARILWAPVIAVVSCLTGCADAITVHPLARGKQVTPDVPPVDGRWRLALDEEAVSVLSIAHHPGDTGQCRGGLVTYTENSKVTEAGDEVCFIELNGQLLAEFHTTQPADFYRQYLVRIQSDRIELCGAFPVWSMLQALLEDRPVGYSLDSLQYTVREQEMGDLMVIISSPAEMREFLELALPELGSACDRGGEKFLWTPFERMPEDESESDASADSQ